MTMIRGTGRMDWEIRHAEKYRDKYDLHDEGRVPIFQPKTIIKYNKDVFEIKWNKLIELGFNNFEIIKSYINFHKNSNKKKAHSASQYIYFPNDVLFYAKNNSSVMEEVIIPALAEEGLLKDFRVLRDFDFKPLADFKNEGIHPTYVPSSRRRTLGDKLKRMTNL